MISLSLSQRSRADDVSQSDGKDAFQDTNPSNDKENRAMSDVSTKNIDGINPMPQVS